jgi:DNA-binding transcriptional LysR family regulator
MLDTLEVSMELRQLRYVVAVARERNFTRAAAKLNMAQPPLSRQIQQLEEELGAILFERGSRPVRLTDAGRLFYEQAVQVIERLDEMKVMTRRAHEAPRPHFRIGFVGSVLYGHLPEVIRRYRAARPGVEISLVELTTLEQLAALKEHRIDVGFGRILFDDPLVNRTLLRNERLCVALPAAHPFVADDAPLALSDVTREPLIIYPKSPRPSYADQVLALLAERSLKPPAITEVRELQTALGLVAAESGVCLVPASIENLKRDNVVYRPLAEAGAVSPIIMSTRKDDPSGDIAVVLGIIHAIFRKFDITFGT